jgi:hypothetical protein
MHKRRDDEFRETARRAADGIRRLDDSLKQLSLMLQSHERALAGHDDALLRLADSVRTPAGSTETALVQVRFLFPSKPPPSCLMHRVLLSPRRMCLKSLNRRHFRFSRT